MEQLGRGEREAIDAFSTELANFTGKDLSADWLCSGSFATCLPFQERCEAKLRFLSNNIFVLTYVIPFLRKLAYSWEEVFSIITKEIIMDKLLIYKAMKMPPIRRVALAELLLASIDCEEEEIRDAWISEVQERMQAVNDGRSTLMDFDALCREAWNS